MFGVLSTHTVLIALVLAALCGNLLVAYQARDLLTSILEELKKGK